jgi:hypothetical protein
VWHIDHDHSVCHTQYYAFAICSEIFCVIHHQTTSTALSYSRALLPPEGPLATHWRIEGCHPHACNLRSTQGHHLAIVSPRHGNGPFHIVVPLAVLNKLPHAGWIEWVDGQLHGTQVTIRLDPAQAWEPRLPALSLPPPWPILVQRIPLYAQQLQRLLTDPQSGLPGLVDRFAAGIQALTSGLRTNNLTTIGTGIEQLAGLGPGLTPAGDDLLLGFLAGLWLRREMNWPTEMVQAISNQVNALATPRTTSLSATWLRHAAQGEFGEPWHGLAQALSSQQRPAMDLALARIAASGATSGLAALSGLYLCC